MGRVAKNSSNSPEALFAGLKVANRNTLYLSPLSREGALKGAFISHIAIARYDVEFELIFHRLDKVHHGELRPSSLEAG